jgi:methyl-accepting chemotaxis protein
MPHDGLQTRTPGRAVLNLAKLRDLAKLREGAAQPGINLVRDYRRQLGRLLWGLLMIGVVAQLIAALIKAAPVWQVLPVTSASIGLIMLAFWARLHVHDKAFLIIATLAGFCTANGALFLNGGWDGSYLKPVLWLFVITSSVGLYGMWSFTFTIMLFGSLEAILGKLFCPDLTYGVGADQSWARVLFQDMWWCLALGGAGYTGKRVITIAKTAYRVQQTLLATRASEHGWAAEAERLRLAAATERAHALTTLARAFDTKIRTVVTAVIGTSGEIGTRATMVASAADVTGGHTRQTSTMSGTVARDTKRVADTAVELGNSLGTMRSQARGAAAAAMAVSGQVAQSDAGLAALTGAIGRVGQAISIIGAIAAQTNLLALNASIEAARAGGAGGGFAIVAAAVKLLAQRSSATAAEINALVAEMQHAGEHAAAALRSIGDSINEVSVFAREVSQAADEQADAIAAMALTITSLNGKAAEVQTQMAEVARSAATTTEAAASMLEAAAALGRDAGALQDASARFIVSVRAA